MPRCLIRNSDIRGIVKQLAERIVEHYADRLELQPITLLVVLDGAMVFATDLIKELSQHLDIIIESIRAKSYDGKIASEVRLSNVGCPESLAGRHVLIVDDIYERGKTLQAVHHYVSEFKPSSLRSVVLLRKPTQKLCGIEVEPDFTGHNVCNKFLVGYGLDYSGRYRALDYVGYFD